MSHTDSIRNGCKDIWNAYMCRGAVYGNHDIPYCPTTATALPNQVITWSEAKAIYKKQNTKSNHGFLEDAFVCWYEDDYKFDGQKGIWHDSDYTLKVLRHFAGVITPDFSTY